MNLAHAYAPPSVSIESPRAEPRQFSVSGAFADAKETLRRRPAALIGLINLGIALTFGLDFLIGLLAGTSLPTMVAGLCAQFVLNTWLSIGIMRIALAAVRRQEFSLRTLFSGGDVLVSTLVSNLLVGFVVLLGTLALIVPGVVASLVFTFSTYVVVDRQADALESLSLSARLSRGQRLRLWLLALASGCVLGAGVLCLGIGLFVALPLVQLMSAHAYARVLGE